MKISRKLLVLGSTLLLFSFNNSAFAQCDPGEIVMKFSHVTKAKGHPKGEAAELFKERINKQLNGKVCMQVYPNSQLYNGTKALEALVIGDLQMAAPSLSKLEKYTKKFRLFDLPFLFNDINAVNRFQLSDDGQKLLNSMRAKGLVGLGFWHNGMKQMSANRPLVKPSDAKGLKFRIQPSDVIKAQFEQIGGNPQKMAFKEVYGALQTGVVDGQENTWSNIYSKKFYEVQDGVTETNHGVLDYLVVTGVDFWEGLPADIRKELKRIFAEVTQERNHLSRKINLENRAKIVKSGKPVRTLSDSQRQEWVNAMKPVWKKFEKDIGADVLKKAQTYNQ
jgi:C4-dicarboxylate-binding protein DctP